MSLASLTNLLLSSQSLLLPLALPPERDDELWTDDYAAAQTRARSEEKDLLLDFTGSDWCAWCIRLHDEVFEQEAFVSGAPQSYVLVTLDFPRDTSRLSEAVQRQNAELRELYPIAGFPTIYLLDAEGRPYATTGYREGGAEPYLEHLARLRRTREARDAAWAPMNQPEATPAQRATALDSGLRALDERLLLPHYRTEIEALVELDPEDALGLATRARCLLDPQLVTAATAEIEAAVAARGEAGDWDGLVDEMSVFALRYRAVDPLAQHALFYQGIGELERGHFDVGRALLERALAADGDGRYVRQVRSVLEALDEEQG